MFGCSHQPFLIAKKQISLKIYSRVFALRKKIADEEGIPPYILFSDATLKELSRYFPTTREDMLAIKGIGEKKFEQYGEAFLEVIQQWRTDHPDVKERVRITDTRPRPKTKKQPGDDQPSHLISYQMFQSGKSLKDIAAIRDMSNQTIENHIFKAYKDGHPVAWDIFLMKRKRKWF